VHFVGLYYTIIAQCTVPKKHKIYNLNAYYEQLFLLNKYFRAFLCGNYSQRYN